MSGEEMGILFSLLSSAIAVITAWIALNQIRVDHKRSRKQKSLDLMESWLSKRSVNDLNVVFAHRLLCTFGPQQCKMLVRNTNSDKHDVISIDPAHARTLGNFRQVFCHSAGDLCDGKKSCSKDLHLTDCEMIFLRSPATKIANELEIVATAWHSGVADKEMLEEEFKDMFVGSERAKFLENFVDATSIYPSVKAMLSYMKSKENGVKKPSADIA